LDKDDDQAGDLKSGLTDPELEARGILDDEVRTERSERHDLARSSRPRFFRRSAD
jgi:hypothetical protein